MKLQVSNPNTLFRVGLILMIIKVCSSYSSIIEVSDTVDMAISMVACLFFAGSIIQKQYTTKTWLTFLGVMVFALFTSLQTGNLMVFIAVLTCLAMCGEDFDNTVRFLLFWEGLYVLVTAVISGILHICGISMLTLVGKEWQYNFGFSHPNVFACIATNLVAMYLYLHFSNIGFWQVIGISVGTVIIYLLTGCRTAVIVVIFLLFFVLVFRYDAEKSILMRFGAAIVVPALSCFFYVAVRIYTSGNKVIQFLDSALSKRIKLGAYGYTHYGISFWGQDLGDMTVKWDPYWKLTAFTFDNVYTYLLMTQLFWLFVLCVLWFKVALRADTKRCVFIFSWALYGVSEIHVINPYLFFVILLVTELFDEAKYRKRNYDYLQNKPEQLRGTP